MSKNISLDRAYILGLLTGGGTITGSTFTIKLPYKNWGEDPKRMAEIARDILNGIQNKFKTAYKISIVYEIGNGCWSLMPAGESNISAIISDMECLSLPSSGNILNSADLSELDENLTPLKIQHFLSGVFDARGSVTKSHRRFFDSAPIVSLEIPGSTKNFSFVTGICQLLTKSGSVTDQILYNHPCQHSSNDPTYRSWKKGFKIRFLAKSFLAKHSFAMQAKSISVAELEKAQKISEQVPCNERDPFPSAVSVHEDIQSPDLPESVRGRLFFHYQHICASLGCPFAPVDKIKAMAAGAGNYVHMFPILSKGPIQSLKPKFNVITNKYYSGFEILKHKISCQNILVEFPPDLYRGVKGALAYLLAEKVRGKRHCGPQEDIIESGKLFRIEVFVPSETGAPALLFNRCNSRAAIISSYTSTTNKSLVESKLSISGVNVNVSS